MKNGNIILALKKIGSGIFSKNHKVVGIQYLWTSSVFILIGFAFMLVMRWQLAFPGQPLSWLEPIFGSNRMPGGILLPEFYNQLGAMHGTIMIFLGVVPLAIGGFGNYLLPLQIGAKEMAFPQLSRLSYWLYLLAGILMIAAFFVNEGGPQSGWTSYPPLANLAPSGQDYWLMGMLALALSSLVGSVNFITTTLHQRAKGMHFFRLPFFVWGQLIASLLLLLAFPSLEVASILQLMDRLLDTSFFMPSGLVISGEASTHSGGGSPLLYQHLFWFLAHPEVYVLILPALGIVCEIIACNAKNSIHGYRVMVYSTLFLGVMSFLVWAHHMFFAGMGPTMSAFFQITTMIISIPSVIILTSLVLSLWGGALRFTVPMLFSLAFLPMFGLGGLTGIPLALAAVDIHLHDTYYVIGHFHYIVAPGTLFALFAGVYHWFPKFTGKHMNELLGKIHFWSSLLLMNLIFFPMFFMGLAGVSRRLWDPTQYDHAIPTQGLNVVSSFAAWGLALVQIIFIINVLWSCFRGKKPIGSNPWNATTLEWLQSSDLSKASSPITVHRSPYEYSVSRKALQQNTCEEEKAA